jgi:hypothetical protein
MKPLTNCPYCGCHLKECKQNENWHEKYCPDHCVMEYHQYFEGDFTSDKLQYISFDTKRFHVYVYFEKGFYPNIIHFYSLMELKDKGLAMPVIDNLPANRVPTHELEEMANSRYQTSSQAREWLDKVDEKLHTLALFK